MTTTKYEQSDIRALISRDDGPVGQAIWSAIDRMMARRDTYDTQAITEPVGSASNGTSTTYMVIMRQPDVGCVLAKIHKGDIKRGFCLTRRAYIDQFLAMFDRDSTIAWTPAGETRETREGGRAR